MKEVLISVQPKWCELIANGTKTVEVRKTKPKLNTPFKCYIYQTVGGRTNTVDILENNLGKVIGEFVCDEILQFDHDDYNSPAYDISDDDLNRTCLFQEDLYRYASGKTLYGWHISGLVIYDKPKVLGEFKKINRECWYADLGLAKRDCSKCKDENCLISRPPQSWCYVEGTIYCKNCKYLMFSDFYAECGKGYRGILNFDDFCDKGELR